MSPENSGPLQTLRLMLTALAILFLGVSVFAYAWGGQSPWTIHDPSDAADAEAAELLRQLRDEGMDCRPRPGRTEMFDCVYRGPSTTRHDGRMTAPRSAQGGNGPLTRAS